MSRREWLYGNILARGFLSVDIAPGGGAKTSQNIVETLAMVSGKPLMGIAPPQRLRVWYWNLEDPADEIDRRILAACLYYGLVEDDLKDHLFVNHGRDTPLCLAKTVQGQTSIDAAIGENLVDQIKANGIDVVIADPFVSSHQVPENDNNAIDLVAKAWGKIAGRGDCGCRLLHHTRKGEQEVNAESGRGASALIGAARIVRVFNRMTKEEGEKAGIEGENYRRYYRTYIDKQNMAPPADRSDWSYLESVGLPNGGLGTAGDSVGASIPWKWPDPLSGMSGHDFDAAAGEIRTGQWRADPQSSQWVGVPIGRALKINISDPMGRGQVKAIIAAWLKAGSLLVVEKPGPNRHVKKWIEVARND